MTEPALPPSRGDAAPAAATRAPARRVTTAYLLSCAAIGVASGVMLVVANWLSTVLVGVVPLLSVALAGLWVLPAVIAMRLLERPGAAVLVAVISGLVASAFSGYGLMTVVTNVTWMVMIEAAFLLGAYRFWFRWQYYAGAAVTGVLYPILSWSWFNLGSQAPWAIVGFFALTLVSCLAATALGIWVADSLRRAGVARVARRRTVTPQAGTQAP